MVEHMAAFESEAGEKNLMGYLKRLRQREKVLARKYRSFTSLAANTDDTDPSRPRRVTV